MSNKEQLQDNNEVLANVLDALANNPTATELQLNLDSHKVDTNNPHQVTKNQVGLENVPNVATNDQTPTYSEASTLKSLTSGEKLATAFGKISKAVSDFIAHLANKNNPHGVTAAQVGASTPGHKHSAEDVTSGTLPIVRGGTGATTVVGAVDALGTLNLQTITDEEHLISEGDDLNSYTTPGAYRCATATIAKSLSNMTPYNSAGFRLIVSALSTEQTKCCFQFAFFNAGMPRFYYRHCNSSGVWQSWTHVVTNILTDEEYGTSLPTAGTKGRIFLKKV